MIVDENPGRTNASNAYNRLLCDALEHHGAIVREFSAKRLLCGRAPDIVHVHFPEFIASFDNEARLRRESTKLFASMRLAKLRGAKVVWTAHNAKPHECPNPDGAFKLLERWHRTVDGVIYLSHASRDEVRRLYPALIDVPSAVIPHGHYRPVLSNSFDMRSARQEAGLPPEGVVVAAIGAVRRYKSLPELIRIFREVGKPTETLLIAGAYGEEALREDIVAAAGGDPRIHLKFGLLSDRQMELLHVAASLLAAPYSGILNSGSAFYALSCSRPFLAPALGSLPEIAAEVGPDWMLLYDGPLTAETLRRAMDRVANRDLQVSPNLGAFDWNTIGSATLAFFKELKARGT